MYCFKFISSVIFILLIEQTLCSQSIDAVGSGHAISFDGVDDFIDFGDIYSDLALPFTISSWVYLDTDNNQPAPVFSNRNCDPIYTGFRLIVNNNVISLEYGDGLGGNNPTFRRGKQATVGSLKGAWNHITAVVKGVSDMDLYLNGIDVGGVFTGTSSLNMDSSKPGFASSAYFISNGVEYRLKGMIDDIRLWNRALSETEIRQTMCVNLMGNEEGLIGYWNFNETSGNTIIDLSANRFNGTIVGNPKRTFSGAPIGNISVFRYAGDLANKDVSLMHDGQNLQVKNISPGSGGVQIYYVDSAPSQTQGLEMNSIQHYFGVFLAKQEPTNTFDATYQSSESSTCGLYTRTDNSQSSWVKGNDSAVTFQQRSEMINAGGEPLPSFDLGEDRVFCDESNYEILPNVINSELSFEWNTGDHTPSIVVNESGTYSLTISGSCDRVTDSITIRFLVTPQPFSLGDDVQMCIFTPVRLTGPIDSTSYTYAWQDGSSNTFLIAKEFGNYSLRIANECGEETDTVVFSRSILVLDRIPNVITPNDDGKNDYFTIPEALGIASLTVFNRWGKEVYHSNVYDNSWTGSGLSSGIYFILLGGPCIKMRKIVLHIVR